VPLSDLRAEDLIRLLSLAPLPGEGGWYRETYRSGVRIPATGLPRAYGGPRDAGTAIYYLLTSDTFSAIHRLRGDEIFHFYLGDPVEMLHLRPDGTGGTIVLGSSPGEGMHPQVVVPAGVWQGARMREGGRFALLGCTVAPGFEFEDFELGKRAELVREYPELAEAIRALTRG
jgi:predicted cupin superfamily sugar epimerase